MLSTMTPGPNEPTAEEMQLHLKRVVNELLELYEHGVIVRTPSYPEGE